jgi:hypothetical protein
MISSDCLVLSDKIDFFPEHEINRGFPALSQEQGKTLCGEFLYLRPVLLQLCSMIVNNYMIFNSII